MKEISMNKPFLMIVTCALLLSWSEMLLAQTSRIPLSTFSAGYGELSGTANDSRGIAGQAVAGRASGSGNVVHAGFIPAALLKTGTVDVPEVPAELPMVYDLAQNYPNPFNPTTTIKYQVPTASSVDLRVYDILGREIVALVNGDTDAGRHTARWNGTNSWGNSVGSGLYFYRLRARSNKGNDSYISIKKMMLLK